MYQKLFVDAVYGDFLRCLSRKPLVKIRSWEGSGEVKHGSVVYLLTLAVTCSGFLLHLLVVARPLLPYLLLFCHLLIVMQCTTEEGQEEFVHVPLL